jgi:membrane protein YqaA with SNARE-associated domain
MEHINHKLFQFKTKTRDWFMRCADSPHVKAWLAFFSFAEATFFPIPPDILLIAIVAARVHKWIYFAIFTTVTSVLGGIVGYAIGALIFETIGAPIVAFYGFEEGMKTVSKLFTDNAFLAIFVSAFSPIPYKVFTLSAGFFTISFPVFVIASLLGRALRFFIVAFLAKKFGKLLGHFVFTYFNAISLFAALLIILLIILLN